MPVAGVYFADVALAIGVPEAVFEDASYHWYVYVDAESVLVTFAASSTLLPISIFLSSIDDNIGLSGFTMTSGSLPIINADDWNAVNSLPVPCNGFLA